MIGTRQNRKPGLEQSTLCTQGGRLPIAQEALKPERARACSISLSSLDGEGGLSQVRCGSLKEEQSCRCGGTKERGTEV